jgi:hypothetical protein
MDEILQIKTSHYIIGAVALVVALSWNSSIKAAINKYFPVPDDELMANFVYAFLITCFLVLLIIWLPNTTSELPAGTQEKITDIQKREQMNARIQQLEYLLINRYIIK